MHETSLVRSLLNQVERLRETHGGSSVRQIEVEIGPLSGVEPLLVREAFDRLAEAFPCVDAELVIHEVSLRACCRDCRAEFTLQSFRFECPKCASRSIRVTHGDEFRLLNVTLEKAQPTESPA